MTHAKVLLLRRYTEPPELGNEETDAMDKMLAIYARRDAATQ